MKLADTNVWLALALSKHLFHDVAQAWLDTETKAQEVLFCRSTQQSFLRLLTTAAMLKPYGALPLTNAEAWTLYERFLTDERIAMVDEPRGLEAHWKALAARETPSPKLWMDAYLAAFAIAGGYRLITTDQGFAQYTGLDLLVLSSKG
jgi:toxin-antitoxin system PIN domain toxin